MAEQSFYQARAQKRHPAATITGDGPHGIVLPNGQDIVLFADFYDARTAADVSGGRQFFIHKPVARFDADFGYRDRHAATA